MSRLAEIVTALERGSVLVGAPDLHTWPEITGLTADSRKVRAGMLYCAVTGSVQDGHRFIVDPICQIGRGAVGQALTSESGHLARIRL